MTGVHLALRHLIRLHPRSLATIAGIMISVASLVALVGLANGIAWTLEHSLEARQADVVVTEAKAFDLMSSILPADLAADMAGRADVDATTPELWRLTSLPDGRSVAAVGWPPSAMSWKGLELVRGALPDRQDLRSAVLGADFANRAELDLGDTITLFQTEFAVIGIVRSPAMLSRNLIYLPLSAMQELTFRDGLATSILLHLAPGGDIPRETVVARLQAEYPDYTVEASEDLARQTSYGRIAEILSLSISTVAILSAALMIFNTMSMAVSERRHEIALLAAIGWARWRIVALIVVEGAGLALLAGSLGMGLGILVARAVSHSALAAGLVEPRFGAGLLVLALLISAGIGVLGAFLPAFRATTRSPSAVLRSR